MGMRGPSWLPSTDPLVLVAGWYTRWTYAVTVNTVREWSIGISGLSVQDYQTTTKVSMTVSEPAVSYPTVYNSQVPFVIGAVLELEAAGMSELPPSITYSYTSLSSGLPFGYPFVWFDGEEAQFAPSSYTIHSQSPNVSVDPNNSFNTGSIVSQKLIGNNLAPSINQGGAVDPQSTADAYRITQQGTGAYDVYTLDTGAYYPYNVNEKTYWAGVQHTVFDLLLDRPNVPLGTLSCYSRNATVFPILPPLTFNSQSSGAQFISALANITGWGGFRYLNLTARITGFSPANPLPRMLLGVVPTTKVNEATCAAALGGSPTYGIWYEINPTEQGTVGEHLQIDTAIPIKGSGTWAASGSEVFTADGAGPYAMPDPLGVGMWTNNPACPLVGQSNAWIFDGDMVIAYMDTASLVLAVDYETATIPAGGNITVNLSEFQFIEKTGSTIAINVNGSDNYSPVSPAGQPSGIETSSPTDGTLLTVTRDGKPAVVIRYRSPLGNPFVAYAGPPYWSQFISVLNGLDNGYVWTFVPLYSNFMTGNEGPAGFLPVPSQVPTEVFKLGASLPIPIKARCESYTSDIPWASVGVISGDDPVLVDTAKATILCLSDYMGSFNFPVTVQSGMIGPGGVVAAATDTAAYGPPVKTTAFGPVELTPDSNGAIYINAGIPSNSTQSATAYATNYGAVLNQAPDTVTFTQSEISPQIDGYFITFDEGLAKGQSIASGVLVEVYVPVRNGQNPPLGYTASTTTSGIVTTLDGVIGPPNLDRSTCAAFCLRDQLDAKTVYSEPRHAFWRLASDSRGRLVATVSSAFSPFPIANVQYPQRGGNWITGYYPQLDVYHYMMLAIYRRQDNKFVRAVTQDQWNTMGDETVLFNQIGGLVTGQYDQSTGSQLYCMSLRNDGLSWLTPPAAVANPGALPQVAVLRRMDAMGNFLPFVTSSTAGISGKVWENVVFLNQPSFGTIAIMILPQGTIVLVCGNEQYTSSDNGSNFYDQTGALVASLTNMPVPPAGATGGTQNPS
jgi:hypothetical protein